MSSRIHPGSPQHRTRIVMKARRMKAEIEQIFIDVDHWNRTHPTETPIDPDPDGQMRQLLDRLNFMLACEDAARGRGPIEPIDAGCTEQAGKLSKRSIQ